METKKPSNMGKIFENNFKESAKKENIFIHRVKDNDLSFNGNSVSKFTTHNPCDFFLYLKPQMFALELKSTCYKSISIQRTPDDPEAMIKAHQINSLIQMSLYDGVNSGFVFNFRNDENGKEITAYMSIEKFSDFLVGENKKSINLNDVKKYGGIKIEQELKRKNYHYFIGDMIYKIINGKEDDDNAEGNI